MKLSDKQISATILGVSLVIGAFLMRPPRYEQFSMPDTDVQRIHGTLDNKTGEVCLHIIHDRPQDITLTEMENGMSAIFTKCSPR